MLTDKTLKIFFYFTFFILSIVIFEGCSYEDEFILNSTSPTQSTYFITEQETSLPMTITLSEGESVYLEACDIKLEFAYISIDCPDYGRNTANIKADYNYGNGYTWIEYDSMNGTMRYQAENETNYVFYFNEIYFVDDHYELDFTVNRYYKL